MMDVTVRITFPESAGQRLSTPWHLLYVGVADEAEALNLAGEHLARLQAPSEATLTAMRPLLAGAA